jgi:hypothetical protein
MDFYVVGLYFDERKQLFLIDVVHQRHTSYIYNLYFYLFWHCQVQTLAGGVSYVVYKQCVCTVNRRGSQKIAMVTNCDLHPY